MEGKEKKKVTFCEWKVKHKTKTDKEHPPTRSTVMRKSTGQIPTEPLEIKALKQRVSLPQTKNKQQGGFPQITKSLVRNCSKAPQVSLVTKSHESKKLPDHTNTEFHQQSSAQLNSRIIRPYTAPKKHSTLKTAQEIRKISELDLEEAYKCVENLKLYDENLQKKVSLPTLNIAPDAKVYTDLVSVDVAEHQLGPRITDIRKHHTRDHRDHEPRPQDFHRQTLTSEDIWPNFTAITAPFNPESLHDGKRIVNQVAQWQEKSASIIRKF